MAYVDSKTTDKLNIIANAAQNILAKNPEIANRIQSLSVKWKNVDGVTVPDIEIHFYEPQKTGINLQKP